MAPAASPSRGGDDTRLVEAAARLERLLEIDELLARVSREVGPALNLETVLKSVLLAMRELVTFRGGSIALVDGNHVRIAAADPAVSADVAAARLPLGKGLAGRLVLDGEPIYCPDLDDDPRVEPEMRRLGSNAEMRSWLGVPLVCLGEIIGVLAVDSSDVGAFTPEDQRLLEGLATQVAGVIESVRRYEAVTELERLKSDFMARVSHELRTPLAIMSGFIATLQRYGEEMPKEDRQRMLARMERANDRLTALIEQLLTLSRLESGSTSATPRRTRLAEVLERVRAGSINPDVVQITCDPGLEVTVDPLLLEQGLGMVLDNSLKYAGDAGLVGSADRVLVRDHGDGLPPEVRRAALEPFTRGHLDVPGLGVGLSMARSLLSLAGGELSLDDNPDGGTLVVIELAEGA